MNPALQKTMTLLLLIALGMLLRTRIWKQEALGGLKEIILSVALPSTIFIALMKIEMDSTLLVVPLLMLLFNLLLYYLVPLAFPLFGLEKNSADSRTLMMLVPSLAPGLSCFPFIAEFLGEQPLAIAALADVGNKFFVLIFLYIMALNMFLGNGAREPVNFTGKIRSLLLSLLKEPVNMLILLAVILLLSGIRFNTLPSPFAELADKTSALMTPLVLIFIGLAVQWKESRKKLVVSILLLRAGITMLFSAFIISVMHLSDTSMILLAVVVPLSSASFWPLAHITVFHQREDQSGLPVESRSFDPELAVLVLAFSLPLSTGIILGILSSGEVFTRPLVLVLSGGILVLAGAIPHIRLRLVHRYPKTS
ncbi:hypothetical protein ACFSQD_09480 [Flavihumibacter stibioxidans]|uniref:Permease n=1 Tax=Flavihumibacter stibioxidans TaxID=1834163 RepID=A0ABR7M6A3_9BACT|nr:hypothetical protein [Flavihumibacter stibioxidans]MBC6490545.1 hypothetical protein [Flavihumibacter stibioxidans]